MVEYDKYATNKKKPQYVKKKENTYRLVCRKKTDHKNMRAVALENKIGQQKLLIVIPKNQLFQNQ